MALFQKSVLKSQLEKIDDDLIQQSWEAYKSYFLGWSYGSLGSIGKQILFYITLGGFGIWAIIRLFTLQGAIRHYNKKIAKELGFSNEELVKMGLVK